MAAPTVFCAVSRRWSSASTYTSNASLSQSPNALMYNLGRLALLCAKEAPPRRKDWPPNFVGSSPIWRSRVLNAETKAAWDSGTHDPDFVSTQPKSGSVAGRPPTVLARYRSSAADGQSRWSPLQSVPMRGSGILSCGRPLPGCLVFVHGSVSKYDPSARLVISPRRTTGLGAFPGWRKFAAGLA